MNVKGSAMAQDGSPTNSQWERRIPRLSRRSLMARAAAFGLAPVTAVTLADGIASTAPVTRSSRQDDRASTLIVAVEGDIDTFDPAFSVNSKIAQTVIQNTFDQLTQYEIVERTAPDGTTYRTVDTERIVPMLAAEARRDGAELIFTLRNDLTFSNGDPIDAETILAGYQRIFETQGISSFLLAMGGGVTDVSAFSAPNPETFVIEMSTPNDLIPKNNVMHNTSAVNPDEIEEHQTETDPWATEYFRQNLGVGSGPYQLESYQPGDAITLVANDRYYGEQPHFERVILKVVPDAVQRVQLLTKGDVDVVTLIPVQSFADLEDDPDLRALSLPSRLLTLLEMNGTIAPFDNKLVRQAVAFATPYEAIIEQIYQGQAAPAKSVIPAGMPTSDFSTSPYVEDVSIARERLAAAGFPDGNGLPSITLSTRIGNDQWEQTAILVQAALREIGMEVTIEKLAYAAFNEAQQGGRLQFWIDEFLSWVNDPFYQLSWMAVSTSPVNFPRFQSDRVDELIAEYTLAQPGPEREAASREVQAIVAEESNYVYVCQPNWTVVTRADIDGYVYYNDELPRFAYFFRTDATEN